LELAIGLPPESGRDRGALQIPPRHAGTGRLRSVEKHLNEGSAEPQVPPLPRHAGTGRSGRDDKERGNGSLESGCRNEVFFISLSGPKAHPTLGMTKSGGLLKEKDRSQEIGPQLGGRLLHRQPPFHQQQPFLCESKKVTGSPATVEFRSDIRMKSTYTCSPSHDQRGMLRPLGTSSADWW
jgi:hypothetical protein